MRQPGTTPRVFDQISQQVAGQLQPVPVISVGDHLLPDHSLPVIRFAFFKSADPVRPVDQILFEQPAQAVGQLPVLQRCCVPQVTGQCIVPADQSVIVQLRQYTPGQRLRAEAVDLRYVGQDTAKQPPQQFCWKEQFGVGDDTLRRGETQGQPARDGVSLDRDQLRHKRRSEGFFLVPDQALGERFQPVTVTNVEHTRACQRSAA